MKLARTTFALLALLSAWMARPAAAQTYPIADWQHRGQFSLSSGYLQFTDANMVWHGVDVGAAATYSLLYPNPALSLFALYAHGFPFSGADAQDNEARIAANLLLYPGPDQPRGVWSVFAGAGAMWRGRTVKDWSGIEAHINLGASINPWLAAYAGFLHGFSARPEQFSDIDQIRAGLTARMGR